MKKLTLMLILLWTAGAWAGGYLGPLCSYDTIRIPIVCYNDTSRQVSPDSVQLDVWSATAGANGEAYTARTGATPASSAWIDTLMNAGAKKWFFIDVIDNFDGSNKPNGLFSMNVACFSQGKTTDNIYSFTRIGGTVIGSNAAMRNLADATGTFGKVNFDSAMGTIGNAQVDDDVNVNVGSASTASIDSVDFKDDFWTGIKRPTTVTGNVNGSVNSVTNPVKVNGGSVQACTTVVNGITLASGQVVKVNGGAVNQCTTLVTWDKNGYKVNGGAVNQCTTLVNWDKNGYKVNGGAINACTTLVNGVNATSISGNSTAADNVEEAFNGDATPAGNITLVATTTTVTNPVNLNLSQSIPIAYESSDTSSTRLGKQISYGGNPDSSARISDIYGYADTSIIDTSKTGEWLMSNIGGGTGGSCDLGDSIRILARKLDTLITRFGPFGSVSTSSTNSTLREWLRITMDSVFGQIDTTHLATVGDIVDAGNTAGWGSGGSVDLTDLAAYFDTVSWLFDASIDTIRYVDTTLNVPQLGAFGTLDSTSTPYSVHLYMQHMFAGITCTASSLGDSIKFIYARVDSLWKSTGHYEDSEFPTVMVSLHDRITTLESAGLLPAGFEAKFDSLRFAVGKHGVSLPGYDTYNLFTDIAAISMGSCGGTGSDYVRVYVKSGATMLSNVKVTVTAPGGTQYPVMTGASGYAAYALDPATYTVLIASTGYIQTVIPATLVVAADSTFDTVSVTAFAPSPPTSPLCRVWGYAADGSGNPVKGVSVSASIPQKYWPIAYGNMAIKASAETKTTSTGYWQLDLYPNSRLTKTTSTWVFKCTETGLSLEVQVPDSTTWELRK